ncbi:MAG: GDSL-type esterase/lipase family protein, partial [Cyclobacteriaceae bacterium]
VAPQEYNQSFVRSPEMIRLEFEAVSSPDIYGLRLENDYGIVMDNIPMRGASGTYFGKINHTEMSTQFANTAPELIVLQFGGNTLPYIEDEERAGKYGGWMASQIRYLKRMNPTTDFVLIGPSDMSIKEGTKYVTYPLLPAVRDALRTAALDHGCGYWDMYEVMGGRNSMPSWVSADPPLAAPDYVHFTRDGARKIAGLFFDALMKDYEEYKKSR